MNRELRQLLVEGGYEPAARPDFRWHQVIVHRNIASVPPVRTVPGAALWNHGFNLILLDEHGMATHYAKCRPAAVPEMMHEATVLTALAGDPVLADIIPRTRTVSSATVRVQVSQFIGDHSWDSDAIIGDVNAWTHAVRGILEVVGRLADRAAVLLPGRVDQRTIRPVDAVGPLLEALVTAGMPNEWIQRLLQKQYTATISYWSATLDPAHFYYTNLLSTSGWNSSGYGTPEMDKALTTFAQEPDVEKRKEAYKALVTLVQQEVPLISIEVRALDANSSSFFCERPFG